MPRTRAARPLTWPEPLCKRATSAGSCAGEEQITSCLRLKSQKKSVKDERERERYHTIYHMTSYILYLVSLDSFQIRMFFQIASAAGGHSCAHCASSCSMPCSACWLPCSAAVGESFGSSGRSRRWSGAAAKSAAKSLAAKKVHGPTLRRQRSQALSLSNREQRDSRSSTLRSRPTTNRA